MASGHTHTMITGGWVGGGANVGKLSVGKPTCMATLEHSTNQNIHVQLYQPHPVNRLFTYFQWLKDERNTYTCSTYKHKDYHLMQIYICMLMTTSQ